MKNVLKISLITLLSVSAIQASVVKYCVKPEKPIAFTSEAEADMYRTIVETYRECATKFIENENKIIEEHSKVLEEAIKDWNTFAEEMKEQ